MRTQAQLANLRPLRKGHPLIGGGNTGNKGPYLTCLLKRLIEKKIRYEDPETQKKIKGTVKDAIIWRYILNATQGETQAIEGIFDRVDGKLGTNGNGKGGISAVIINIRNQSGLLSPAEASTIPSERSQV